MNVVDDLYGGLSNKPISERVFPGSLAHFIAGMAKLNDKCAGTFASCDGGLLYFSEDSPREIAQATWIVTPCEIYTDHEQGSRYGQVTAYEDGSGTTCSVVFWDNAQSTLDPEDPIRGFEAFCGWVLLELWPETEWAVNTSAESVILSPPTQPERPPKGANMDAWFTYFHFCDESGIKFTLKQVAEETGYTYGYVRQRHAAWKEERET